MVFNATFIDISAISWWLVLLVEETGVPGEIHKSAASHLQTLSNNVVSAMPFDNKLFCPINHGKPSNVNTVLPFDQ